MSRRTPPIYRRGKYWLGWDEREDGTRRSPNLTVFWYDDAARRVRSASTGTPAEDAAIVELDRRYLGDRGEAPAYCQACGQPRADADAYLLTDAIADYRLEWGDNRSSSDSIAARLQHVVRFLEVEEARDGRFGLATSCTAASGNIFIEAFRSWSRLEPVTWKNGRGEVTVTRPRAPATTEEAVIQLAAVLNHAVDADPPRSTKRPTFRPIPRQRVSRPRRTRIDVPEIARMLSYAAEPGQRRGSLHAFLIASICTIARPDAVVDINVRPDRGQWYPGWPAIDLNPVGRIQTKKFRPSLPVLPLLATWLMGELDAWYALDPAMRPYGGWLVNYFGRPVRDVGTAWTTMLKTLGMPNGREWRPYLLRHSMGTIARRYGAEKWDLEGFMGHRARSSTEVYAVSDFPSVEQALQRVVGEIESLSSIALHRSVTGAGLASIHDGRSKMSG